MMYSVCRLRHWTIEVRRDRIGGHVYAAWPGARASRPLHPPVSGWSEGKADNARLDAIGDIDRLDGLYVEPECETKIFRE